MIRMAPITVTLADAPEVARLLSEAAAEIEALKAERDEWEERYEELLSAIGGTWPA